jgi:lysozyme
VIPVPAELELALSLCGHFEGFSARPYLCPAGVWTIGKGATYYLDGRPVKPDDPPISEQTADKLLIAMLTRVYVPTTRRLCPRATGAHLAALSDFAFNLGCSRLAASTLRRAYNAGDIERARIEIKKWDRAAGKRLAGLTARRAAEAALLKKV